MKHFLREPLLHLLVIGVMLFGAYSFLNPDVNEKRQTITISAPGFGDRFLGQYDFDAVNEQTVANVLGLEFERQVFAFQPEIWQRPIASGYGLHLVLVKNKLAAQPQDFNAVKNEVLTLWRRQRAQEGLEQYFAELHKKYSAQIDDSIKTFVDTLAVSTGPRK